MEVDFVICTTFSSHSLLEGKEAVHGFCLTSKAEFLDERLKLI